MGNGSPRATLVQSSRTDPPPGRPPPAVDLVQERRSPNHSGVDGAMEADDGETGVGMHTTGRSTRSEQEQEKKPPNVFSEEYCVLQSTARMRLCVTIDVSLPARASVVPRNLPNQWNYTSALASPL